MPGRMLFNGYEYQCNLELYVYIFSAVIFNDVGVFIVKILISANIEKLLGINNLKKIKKYNRR